MKHSPAIFFDFDGVLVDSTATKTEAYRELFAPYGPEVVSQIVAHHRQNGGISRVEKIDYAHRRFLDRPYSRAAVERDVARYSQLVFEQVVTADWVAGAREFVAEHYGRQPMFIISGTPEDELKAIVDERDMTRYFDEIRGAPIKKPAHIEDLVARYGLKIENCCFIGDALTDYDAARETGMAFIGIHTEVDFPDGTLVLPDCRDLDGAIERLMN